MGPGHRGEFLEPLYQKDVIKIHINGNESIILHSLAFAAYFNSISRHIYNHGSPQCARTLNGILTNITQLVESGNHTRLVNLFNLCEGNDFSHPLDATTFFERIFYLITIYIDTRQ